MSTTAEQPPPSQNENGDPPTNPETEPESQTVLEPEVQPEPVPEPEAEPEFQFRPEPVVIDGADPKVDETTSIQSSSEGTARPELKKDEGSRTFTMRELLNGLKNDQGNDAANESSSPYSPRFTSHIHFFLLFCCASKFTIQDSSFLQTKNDLTFNFRLGLVFYSLY